MLQRLLHRAATPVTVPLPSSDFHGGGLGCRSTAFQELFGKTAGGQRSGVAAATDGVS